MKKQILLSSLAACLIVVSLAWGKEKETKTHKAAPANKEAASAKEVPQEAPAPPPSAAAPAPATEVKAKNLDLATAQRIALKDNPSIGAAQARIEQAKAKIRQVMATLGPNVDAMANLGVQGDKEKDEIAKNSAVGLQGAWLIFDGYARKFQQEQAEYGEKSSVESKRNSQRMLVASVADAFFNAQLAKTSVDIASADQEFYEQQLKDAKHRFEAGTGSWGDVLNIKVQVNSAKNSMITAKRQYEAARYGLAALLGIEDSVSPELADLEKDFVPSDEELTADTDALIKEAMTTRPDLKRLTLQIKAAEAGVNASGSKEFTQSADHWASRSLQPRGAVSEKR
ncbi:TolC family protein [Desulfobulbus sp. F4]|nr:TolC family protein [Desulfobulbus sp. F4]